MRGIFISQAVLNKNNGGGQFVRSLIGLLRMAVGYENLTVVSLPDEFGKSGNKKDDSNLIAFNANPGTLEKAYNLLCGCPRYVSPEIFDEVFDIIEKEKYDFVFLGFSTYKCLIKRIKKKTTIPVFVMYQGIAPNTKKTRLLNAPFFKKVLSLPSYLMVLNRENVNATLSDCNIVHNKRERDVFYHYYSKEPDLYLPVFIGDKFENRSFENPGYEGFSLLFIGSNFGPNISGLKWFVENVMNHIGEEINLYVVGQGMEVLRENSLYQSPNIKVIGEVDDLAPWYYWADLVVEPIFEGDGMKTKTVEAMMYGKTILGTDEAFCGYTGLEDYLCNTADEFVQKINAYKKSGVERLNEKVRTIYINQYSEKAVLETMRKAILEHVKDK